MKNQVKLVSIVFLAVLMAASAMAVNYYEIILPSYPPRGQLQTAAAVNDANQIVGPYMSTYGQGIHVWQDGDLVYLPVTGEEYYGHDINAHGCVVGGADYGQKMLFWDGQTITDLGFLPGGDSGFAYALNDANEVVGRSRMTGYNVNAPYLWKNGTMTNLGTLGGTYGEAFDINNHCVIVGHSQNASGDSRAFVWEDGTLTDLGTLGGDASMAFSINDANQIVGFAEVANGYQHACLWENGSITDLGTLGGNQSQAYCINNDGVIFGWAETETGYRPLVLWVDDEMIRLNDLIPRNSGWELVNPDGWDGFPAYKITNGGRILGTGYINRWAYNFLMIPTNRPYLYADPNKDQKVNLLDVSIMASEWLK